MPFIHREKAEYSDGVIDLIPLRIAPPDPGLGFGREKVWRITLHGERNEIGQLSYRTGESRCVYYYGHIGYHVDPPWRGHHYARRACRLIREEIARSGKISVVITCDPDNLPSKKTCLALGSRFEGIVDVPEDIRKRYEISERKCRFIWIPTRPGDEDDG